MRNLISLIGFSLLMWSCQQEPDDIRLLDDLVVSTNYDTETFGSGASTTPQYATYAIPKDTIGFITNTDPDDTIRTYSTSFKYPRLVIDAVKTNMAANGYELVDLDQNPDLGVNVYIVTDLNLFQQVVYPNYYSSYYGYGGYYYYPYVQTYAYNTATLVVELIDLKNRNGNKVKVVWNAYMGDVINSVDYEQQSVDAIHQAFVQSPYLKRVP